MIQLAEVIVVRVRIEVDQGQGTMLTRMLLDGRVGTQVIATQSQGVHSGMTKGFEDAPAAMDGMLTPEQVADSVVKSLEAEEFLITPHPEVNGYFQAKAANYDRWLGGMRKLNRMFAGKFVGK